jgi:hypothetical protein
VAGQLLHIEPDGRQVSRGPSNHASARNATIVWKPRHLHPPTTDDTVWLLTDGAQAGPWSLATLADMLPLDGEPVQGPRVAPHPGGAVAGDARVRRHQ